MDGNKLKGGSVGLSYPTLTRENYTAWSMKMRVFMQAHGVWDTIESSDPKIKFEDKIDKVALAMIYQGVPEDVLLSLADKRTAKEAWVAIKTLCQDEWARVNIRALGEEVSESYIVKKLLRAVPSKFLQIASTIEQFGDLEKMSVEEAVGSLKAHEERLKGQTDKRSDQLLLTKEEWLKSERNEEKLLLTKEEWQKRSNRGGTDGSANPRGRWGRDKSRIKCYNCHVYGHYMAESKAKTRKRTKNGS
ncbi:uncharacterized protein LOC141704404 [Apium graveolens]|uniref:uncharacterized protein LOC141703598 n=1 Tax=Apium graveolens TaxID=4045 RepID=UPI003D7A0227